MHRRVCCPAWTLILLVLASFTSKVQAQLDINTDRVKSALVFLYASDSQGKVMTTTPLGTGVFVCVPFLSDPKHSRLFLVTARHMFDRTWAGCGSPNPIRVFARLNKRDYDPEKGGTGVEYVPLDITDSDGPRWKKHSDDAVDAAVFLVSGTAAFTAAFKDIAFDAILLSDFATEEEMSRLLEGFQVVSAGLLPAQPGSRRNYPFFKFGHISNRIAEEVEVRCTPQSAPRLTRLWFIAANLVPGNSGSPIFHVKLSPPGIRFSGEMRTMLVGVQSISFSGADIAGMTPISFVYDIVKSMKLPDTDLRRGTK